MAKKKKNPVGRPPKYADPELFDQRINEYFDSIIDEDGEYKRAPTVTGLALSLGFVDRQSMYAYKGKEQFNYIVKRAISRIEEYHEQRAATESAVTGSIFVMKNMGWKDKFEHETNTNMDITWHETRTYETDEEADDGD
jgi:hypothetical protein